MAGYVIILRCFISVKLHNIEYERMIVNDESVRMKESQTGRTAEDQTDADDKRYLCTTGLG
jgi:hypothetical protein